MCGLIGWLGLLLLFGLFVLDGGLGWRGGRGVGFKGILELGCVCMGERKLQRGVQVTSKTSSSGGILGNVCVREKQAWLI